LARKSEKTLSGLKLNFFQWTENEIRVTIQNPFEGKQALITSVGHTNRHHGKNKARITIFSISLRKYLMQMGNGKRLKKPILARKETFLIKKE
jgi:hypothetical protein